MQQLAEAGLVERLGASGASGGEWGRVGTSGGEWGRGGCVGGVGEDLGKVEVDDACARQHCSQGRDVEQMIGREVERVERACLGFGLKLGLGVRVRVRVRFRG